MKKLLLTLPSLLFVACGDKTNQQATYAFLTFESAPIYAGPTIAGENLYSSYTGANKFTYFTDEATELTLGLNTDNEFSFRPEFYAGGIAPSNYALTDLASIPMQVTSPLYIDQTKCQSAVFDAGGKSGSEGFGLVYAPNDVNHNPMPAEMRFPNGVERVVHSLWVNNATYVAKWLQVNHERVSNAKNPNDLVWMGFWAAGYNAKGERVGIKQLALMVDYRANSTVDGGKITRWTQCFLHDFGKVNRIEFSISSNDEMLPTYVCIDDVAVIL